MFFCSFSWIDLWDGSIAEVHEAWWISTAQLDFPNNHFQNENLMKAGSKTRGYPCFFVRFPGLTCGVAPLLKSPRHGGFQLSKSCFSWVRVGCVFLIQKNTLRLGESTPKQSLSESREKTKGVPLFFCSFSRIDLWDGRSGVGAPRPMGQ